MVPECRGPESGASDLPSAGTQPQQDIYLFSGLASCECDLQIRNLTMECRGMRTLGSMVSAESRAPAHRQGWGQLPQLVQRAYWGCEQRSPSTSLWVRAYCKEKGMGTTTGTREDEASKKFSFQQKHLLTHNFYGSTLCSTSLHLDVRGMVDLIRVRNIFNFFRYLQ